MCKQGSTDLDGHGSPKACGCYCLTALRCCARSTLPAVREALQRANQWGLPTTTTTTCTCTEHLLRHDATPAAVAAAVAHAPVPELPVRCILAPLKWVRLEVAVERRVGSCRDAGRSLTTTNPTGCAS